MAIFTSFSFRVNHATALTKSLLGPASHFFTSAVQKPVEKSPFLFLNPLILL